MAGIEAWIVDALGWIGALDIPKWIKYWDTLIAGVLALAGALLAWRAVRHQVAQAAELAEDRRMREERAARVVLPLALADLTNYATQCIAFADRYRHRQARGQGTVEIVPAIPLHVTSTLQSCARYAAEDVVAKIAKILGDLQVLNSRMERFVDSERIANVECLDRMKDAAALHVAISELFPYSRDENAPPPSASGPERLRSALRVSGIHDPAHPIWTHIALR